MLPAANACRPEKTVISRFRPEDKSKPGGRNPAWFPLSGSGEADVRAFRAILDRDGLNGSAFRIGAGRRVVEREIRRPGMQLVVDDVEGV